MNIPSIAASAAILASFATSALAHPGDHGVLSLTAFASHWLRSAFHAGTAIVILAACLAVLRHASRRAASQRAIEKTRACDRRE